MKKTVIGLDLGNSDVKTVHSTLPTGFEAYRNVPFGIKKYMEYNGKIYISSTKRSDYQQDKTTTDLALILSMMGIAQELIDRITSRYKDIKLSKDIIQNEISKINDIALGVGLPPLDFAVYAMDLKNYYLNNFKHMSYEYNGYHFEYSVTECKVYAQGLNAALTYNPKAFECIPKKYERSEYYIIDIGGYTVDIITMENGVPIIPKCYLLSRGIIPLGDEIISRVQMEFGQEITRQNIEAVLQNRNNVVKDEIKEAIVQLSEEWTSSIINESIQKGLKFGSVPTVFIGGGSQLLKPYIERNSLIGVHEYISDPKANAIGYEKALRNEIMRK